MNTMMRGLAVALVLLAGTAVAASPEVTIVSPADGAVLRSPVVLRTAVANAELGAPKDGLYHLHFSVDGGQEVALYRAQDVSLPLPPGMHVIAVEIAGPNHRAIGPPSKVAFMVRE